MAKKLTTEDFIVKAKVTHGDRYDYSLAKYTRTHDNLIIICKEHGPFEQAPANHYKGKGCPICGGSKPHTIESFIKSSQSVHGSKYDYSKVQYTNNKAQIIIICPDHGPFTQIATLHLKGHGCPACAGCKRHDTESFISKAREVHGDKYDYSKAIYKSSHTPLKVICSEHGEFSQIPTNHFSGNGCPECGRLAVAESKRKTTDQFIAKAHEIHGNRYDYSLVKYERNSIKVSIICRKHGPFEQTPSDHLSGYGCSQCGIESRIELRTKSTEEFIVDAIKVHGNRYDYGLVEYLNGNENVTIICSEHGAFVQKPSKHLSGSGCYQCGLIASADAKRSNKEEFIAKAKMIHGDRYDYSLVEYVRNSEKVTMICPDHGPFEQIPNDHIGQQASGCPDCAETGFNPKKPGLLYYLAIDTDDSDTCYKIGITNLSVEKRFRGSDLSRIRVIKVWRFGVGQDAAKRESAILKKFSQDRYFGPRLLAGAGNTELFMRDVLGLDTGGHSQEQATIDADANLISGQQLYFDF